MNAKIYALRIALNEALYDMKDARPTHLRLMKPERRVARLRCEIKYAMYVIVDNKETA